ncbi:MAG: sugar-binding domain-containing protein [Candidatus Acidiferrales bacterium]
MDGGDWLLGSFPMDGGVAAGAQREDFDDSHFRPVQVPGEVQLQLGLKGMDLFRQTRELTSINFKEWWYRKHFKAPPRVEGKRILLQFDGADYFASVWLNGKLLSEHEGTYVPFSFDVTSLLRHDGENVLAVRLTHPWIPKDRGLDEYMKGDFTMSVYPNTLTLDHPPYTIHVGWDALPAHGNAAFSMGLWRGVHLTVADPVIVSDLYVRTVSIQPDGSATLAVSGELDNADPEPAAETVELSIRPATFAGEALRLPPIAVRAGPGETPFNTQVQVKNARLWWTWDTGAQDMYELTARIEPGGESAQTGASGDVQSVRFGIRTLTRDSSMAYRLNGKRIFIKASWFPISDYYESRSTQEAYDRDLRLFRDANLNLVVNFTVVEKPAFYDLCDELGILIVDELPFPQFGPGPALASDSPRRQPFLQEAAKEVTQIVIEHRNHPSIVEWAPLAEADEHGGGIDNGLWGFGGYLFDQSGYQTFVEDMRNLIERLEPGSVFQPSLCDLGEKHFWIATAGYRGNTGVYQQYFDALAPFVSEYGSIAMSSYENLDKYLTRDQQWDPANHTQPRWFGLPIDISAYSYMTSSEYDGLYSMLYRTEHYVDRDIRSPRELVDDTQIYQAFLMKYATEAFRRKEYDPIMGIRFWDFHQLAPGFRFGILDYDQVPKVSYWWTKKAMSKLAVSFAYKNALGGQSAGSKLSIPVWAINDLDHAVDAKVDCNIYDLRGKVVFNQSFSRQIPTDGKAKVGDLDWILPDEPGVYLVRALLSSSRPADRAEDTTFVKVVPKAFSHPVRVLLIAQAKIATPIAAMLLGAGIPVDVLDQESVGRFDVLADGAALHAKYDVIWLASFENFAKVFPPVAALGVKQAVAAGTGFIHTGGQGSYHGGQTRQALIELTPLADLLPVTIQNSNDLAYGEHTLDDTLETEAGFKDITATPGVEWAGLPLLDRYGLPAFNRVTAKPGSQTRLLIHDQPLLVTGEFGHGHTISFTGFTPVQDNKEEYFLDQQLIQDPANRTYFEAFVGLVALAAGEKTTVPVTALLSAMEKPLFQTLKEQPATRVDVQLEPGAAAQDQASTVRLVRLKNGVSYAHLVRLRVEWNAKAPQPYFTEFSDNAFEMLPGEEKTITLSWKTPAGAGTPSGTLIVDGANVTQSRLQF